MTIVLKVGGNELSKPGFLTQLGEAIVEMQEPCVIVHGGGRVVDAMLDRLGIVPTYYNGQRVTDETVLEVVEMVLSGQVNKQLTHTLVEAGVDAVGMSGVDRGLIRVEPWATHMGRVGRIVQVRGDVLRDLASQGVVPVISPISMGPGGRYNVNADHAAGTVAGALGASQATFLTNVPGVRVGDEVAGRLSAREIATLIAEGVIHGGMIPKVNAALDALRQGVREAKITDLPGFRTGAGTLLVKGVC